MGNVELRLLFLMVVVILSTTLACSRVLGDSVIYVYKNSGAIQSNYISALEDIGFSVDTVSYSSLGSINFDDYDLILVGNERFTNPDLIPVNDYPSLIVNSYHVDDWGWSDAISSIGSNQPLWAQKASNNYITYGFPSEFQIYTQCCYENSVSIPAYYLSRFNKAYSIETVVATTSHINDAIIGITEPGDKLLYGKTAHARGCFFGIHESSVWTDESQELFQRCAVYSAFGFDRDGDGFREDVDCDDNNPNIYPGAPEVCNGLDDDCDKLIDEDGNFVLCDDGLYCNGAEYCGGLQGCRAGTPINCSYLNTQCKQGVCNENTDSCERQNANEGLSCDDGQYCNVGETCQSGICTGGSDRDCSSYANQCNEGECDEYANRCYSLPTNEGLSCNDGKFCIIGESCHNGVCGSGTPKDCSHNNLPKIATCTNNPDNNALTWDSAQGFTSVCDENSDICTQGSYTFTHACNMLMCGAQCEITADCVNKCVGSVRYYNGNCLSHCVCDYSTEDCDQYDGWYDTLNLRWVNDEECTEKEQKEQEYREYSCSPGECVYTITNTHWVDTENKRNKTDGTVCEDGEFCTVGEGCQSGVCSGGTPKDCNYLDDQCNVGVCNEDTNQCEQDPTPYEGLLCDDGLFCTVNDVCTCGVCDGDARDCSDGVGCTVDSCDKDTDSCNNIPHDSLCLADTVCADYYCDAVLDCQVNYELDTKICKASAGDCDIKEYCTGSSAECPADEVKPATAECRASAGICDVAEYCDSISVDCPRDEYRPSGTDCGVCAACNGLGNCMYDKTQDSDCSDTICQDACGLSPDDNPFTWDYADDVPNECISIFTCSNYECSYTHECSIDSCGAECETDDGCSATECDNLDGCYDGTYKDYDDVENFCEGCTCTSKLCTSYTEIITDLDGDGYDIECDNDCNDNDATIYPGATEIMDDIDQNCVNDAPSLLSNIPDQTWSEDTTQTINLSLYFDDVDGDALSFTSTSPSNINVNIDGSIVTLTPDTNWFGSHTITFTANDGSLATNSNVVTLSVTPVNDAPTISVPDQTLSEDSAPVSLDLTPYANDIEGESLSYIITKKDVNKVKCEISGSNLVVTPALNFNGLAQCSIKAYDGIDYGPEDSFNINVLPINDAPSVTTIPDQTWQEDTIRVIDLNNYFSDVDGDVLSYTSTPLTNINIVITNNIVKLTPNANWNGAETISFSGSDGEYSVDSDLVTLSVTPVNDAPVLEYISEVIITEGDLVDIDPIAMDIDGDTLSFSFTAPLDENGEWQTDFCDSGVYVVTVSVSDGLTSDSQEVSIIVNEWGNHAPVLDFIPDISITEGDFVKISPSASDVDCDDLTFTFTPPLDKNGEWQTNYMDSGVYVARITVSDGLATDWQDVSITVLESGNHAPILDFIPGISVVEGELVKITLHAVDPDGDDVSYGFTAPLNENGAWQTSYLDSGSYVTVVSASDGSLTDWQEVTINVLESGNHPPVLDHIPDISITEGDFIKIMPSASDPDRDSISFTFTWPLNSQGEWQTDFNDAGTYMVTISALDGKGGMDSQQVTITVNEAGNHAPVLDYIPPIIVTEGDLVKIMPSATDLDYDALSFSFTSPLNPQGEWQTTYVDAGTYVTTVTVSDGLATDWQDVSITVLESGNHAPVIDVEAVYYVTEEETLKVSPSVYDPDTNPVTISYSAPLNSNGEWQTKKGDKGTYYASISASDGLLVTTVKIKIVVSEPPYSDIYIGGIKIFNYKVKPGTNLEMSISFSDSGNIDIKGVKVAAYIPELGLYRRIGPFNLEKGEDITKNLIIYIPPETEKGEYTLKIVISNDDVRREKHRTISVV